MNHNLEREKLREHFSQQLKKLFPIKDTRGIEVFSTMNRISRLGEVLGSQTFDEAEVSGPRWRLMLRLLIEEQMGNLDGLTPTVLSRWQRVSKNTVSSLLRGLEEQGLIQRNLDPKDLRVFRIQLTQAGRDLMMSSGPKGIERLNDLLTGLEPQEVEQLQNLLDKLQHSVMLRFHDHLKEQNRY